MDSTSNPLSQSSKKLRIFVFDSPRTCSHLLRKLFLQHPQLGNILEPFLVSSVFSHQGVVDHLSCSEAAWSVIEQARSAAPELATSTYSEANQMLRTTIETFEHEGKIPWIKDHALYSLRPELILSTLRSGISVTDSIRTYSNPTLIEDTLLHSFKPIFLIRHPVLVMRSYWEVNLESIGSDVQDEQFVWMTSVHWVRILFEFYRNRSPAAPLVVDAEDVVHRTAELTDQICERLGLDRTGVVFEWEPEANVGQLGDFFKTRVRASRGVERGLNGEAERQLDVDIATAEWTDNYGESIAKALRQRVEAEMPDYEYLRQFKLLL